MKYDTASICVDVWWRVVLVDSKTRIGAAILHDFSQCCKCGGFYIIFVMRKMLQMAEVVQTGCVRTKKYGSL